MHQRNHAALPIILADTSALMDLACAEMDSDFTLPPNADSFSTQSFGDLIDALTGGGQRTLITTRANFIECFRTQSGHFDLAPDAENNPQVEAGAGQEEFKESDGEQPFQLLIHNLFGRYQQTGKLRSYLSIEEMLAAGEIDAAKGGIVIVDTQSKPNPLNPDGKYNRPNMPYEGTHDRTHFAPRHNRANESGDNCLVKLANHIQDYTQRHHLPQRYLFLNNDTQLSRRIYHLSRGMDGQDPKIAPYCVRAHELLWAMTQSSTQPKIKEATARRYTNAMQHRREKDGYQLVNDEHVFFDSVARTTQWLKETKQLPAIAGTARQQWVQRHASAQSGPSAVQTGI
ncbi:MAG: hypothetical protein ACKVOE_04860 [Rickettsiales bacterium]